VYTVVCWDEFTGQDCMLLALNVMGMGKTVVHNASILEDVPTALTINQ
jgi:hypothetical protein